MTPNLKFTQTPTGTLTCPLFYQTNHPSPSGTQSLIVVYRKPNTMYDWLISDNMPYDQWSDPDPKGLYKEKDLDGFWDTESTIENLVDFLYKETGIFYEWTILRTFSNDYN